MTTTDSEIEKGVIQLVRDYWKAANIKNVQITDRDPSFARGALYDVSIYDANNEEHENYVYVVKGRLRRYDNMRELAGQIETNPRLGEVLRESLERLQVSGIIATTITATMCYLALKSPDHIVNQPLMSALTLILGYYFGADRHKRPA